MWFCPRVTHQTDARNPDEDTRVRCHDLGPETSRFGEKCNDSSIHIDAFLSFSVPVSVTVFFGMSLSQALAFLIWGGYQILPGPIMSQRPQEGPTGLHRALGLCRRSRRCIRRSSSDPRTGMPPANSCRRPTRSFGTSSPPSPGTPRGFWFDKAFGPNIHPSALSDGMIQTRMLTALGSLL